jgi:hypothetical protein
MTLASPVLVCCRLERRNGEELVELVDPLLRYDADGLGNCRAWSINMCPGARLTAAYMV